MVPFEFAAQAPAMVRRMLLIDDDPVFCRLALRWAQQRGIHLVTCTDSQALPEDTELANFDVAVIDCHMELDRIGDGARLAGRMQQVPVLMISADRRADRRKEPWPPNVYGFMDKYEGLASIFAVASTIATAQKK